MTSTGWPLNYTMCNCKYYWSGIVYRAHLPAITYIYTYLKHLFTLSVWTDRISQILSPLSISWLKTKEGTEVPEVSEETTFDVLNGFHLKPSTFFLKTTVCHFDVIFGSSLLTQLRSQAKAPSHVSKQPTRLKWRARQNLAAWIGRISMRVADFRRLGRGCKAKYGSIEPLIWFKKEAEVKRHQGFTFQ